MAVDCLKTIRVKRKRFHGRYYNEIMPRCRSMLKRAQHFVRNVYHGTTCARDSGRLLAALI